MGYESVSPDPRFLLADEMKTIDVHSIPFESETSFIFEVDRKSLMKLHDYHNDNPLATKSFQIKPEMLSPYQKEVLTNLWVTEGTFPNLFYKRNDVRSPLQKCAALLSFGVETHQSSSGIVF